MSFLKAEWRKLALANYSIDPSILQKYVPAGTELDLWNGNCYVSLVGFMFLNMCHFMCRYFVLDFFDIIGLDTILN